jgi:hypothetical protein
MRILKTTAAAIAGLALWAPVASAGSNESIATERGKATFEHKDEVISAEDRKPDGIGIEARLEWTDAAGDVHRKRVVDADGADIPTLFNIKDLFIREGTRVRLRLCYVGMPGPKHTKCSRPQGAVA